MITFQKVNAVGAQDKALRTHTSDINEEDKNLDRDVLGF